MTAETQDLKTLLLSKDDEFRQLVEKHQELEARLHELSTRPYLSEPERVEEVTLKKRKLHLKDRMEDIVRRYRNSPATSSVPIPHPTPHRG
jgi:uncharacterized protein YdcH (DUF465 family)